MSESVTNSIAFFDIEVNPETKKITDIGSIKQNQDIFHSPVIKSFMSFINNAVFLCGHNIIHHDLKYLNMTDKKYIDTLFLSPLLFPKHPYHKLLKDDKIYTEELNNPLNDAKKAKDLFYDEVNAYNDLPKELKTIYAFLLGNIEEFKGFFEYVKTPIKTIDEKYIKNFYKGKFCENVELQSIIAESPIELAYALAIIGIDQEEVKSITPAWVLKQYPKTEIILKKLCNTPCENMCSFCEKHINIYSQLKKYFNYTEFRTYEGEPLQEKACKAAVENKSLIAIFPTGGGKSLTFQLPALIAGETIRGLTVVISPLQSLMKDQIDNLEKKNIVEAVTINGLLSPIERAEAFNRVENGIATILYLSPEQLRSKTIERLLLSRNVVRFVIDEAHCFSAWGQDFRVDYLYIGEFIQKLQKKKDNNSIAISCFTATAKPKVIMDIKEYFKEKLDLELELFASSSTRKNLKYAVIFEDSPEKKYHRIRSLIEAKNCPTIVYIDSVEKTETLAARLTNDNFPALPYNGRMDAKDKIRVQNKFINNEVKIIVATSAFGMGVDKQDIELIIHYNAPNSLEDYMQESGRAAREQTLNANCYILFSPNDIDRHFVRLNQDKLTMNEIQQIWQAIKRLTKYQPRFCRSATEIARCAGWNYPNVRDIEVKVKTALLALENAGYIKREENMPRIYATSINSKTLIEAQDKMRKSGIFNEEQMKLASLVLKDLIGNRRQAMAGNDISESRVDWLADRLGFEKYEIIDIINLMRQINLLADDSDMGASLTVNSEHLLNLYIKLESYLINSELNVKNIFSLKELNEKINNLNIKCEIKYLRTIFNFWKIQKYVEKSKYNHDEKIDINISKDIDEIRNLFNKRIELCKFIIKYFKEKALSDNSNYVVFSENEILREYNNSLTLKLWDIKSKDVRAALLWLHRTEIISLDGGFLVFYSGFSITRLVTDNKIKYKREDYKFLDNYYKQKIQQIHIVNELLNILVKSYKQALEFIKDYFQLDYKDFIGKYFKDRTKEIQLNMTPGRYKKLFGVLSDKQKEIIEDDTSQYIVVAAGPGSGKTMVLVHKLASLLTLEDIKSEQLLMLTFSRAAAIEFKKRLYDLIETSAHYVEIRTFHSYCFDILGRPGSLETSDTIVKKAVTMINNGEVESSRIAKTVLVIDEAQDMSEAEFALIESLINYNTDMRLIAVGDDDQNIYEFRGSNSQYLQEIITKYGAKKYEMVRNYRSCQNIVQFANEFANTIKNRMKETNCTTEKAEGSVKLIKYTSKNLEEPLVNNLIIDNFIGSTCILTKTNDEALKILGILNKKGIPAKLIQSLEGFSLLDLQEVRFIMWLLNKNENPIQISDKLWGNIKKILQDKFNSSNCLKIVLKMLDDFEKTNPAKYYSDLETFFAESKLDDFYDYETNTVTISTIHKAKGHEFDNVYMLMNGDSLPTDENKRKIYVGITRAKNNLQIHYNDNIFDQFEQLEFINKNFDNKKYNQPDDIILQLSHKDVILDYFKYRQNIIPKLRSGKQLIPSENGLLVNFNGKETTILKYSASCRNKIESLIKQGYKISSANIRFIVYWKKQDDDQEKEYAIILPDIKFSKS